ncbi:arginine--tRNA ligase [candidate division LCP-89 bacterium B3_LCP]|uniref:Arginine--tRNA ligase n=1 Tax=candidate division LCP-89 bacterium B3_LCP TaxID=2012998 RepID=A0A532UY46_UNCL8|nr:MAG: arginine--tRNA ligase [candidate division LCP-89 bacterium B3_LCP]
MNLTLIVKGLIVKSLGDLDFPEVPIVIEVPPDPNMGDRSCTVALSLAKQLKQPPRQIAEQIKNVLPIDSDPITKVEIAGPGYLNFFFSENALIHLLQAILRLNSDFGNSDRGAGQRRLFEYVSANPTGPMNVVSARAAALGDSMVKLQRKIGFSVDSEFYINDAGKQIMLLGASVKARAGEVKGNSREIPEGGYHGSYVKQIAAEAIDEFGDALFTLPDEDLGCWSADRIVENQRSTLEDYGIQFDNWFKESELRRNNEHQTALKLLEEREHTYSKDGALFFRSTSFGDNEDRVLITSDERPTYFLPDIAYHVNKSKRGYDKVIDLLGPDHHGHGLRMQAAMKAVGLPDDFLEVVIVQQVNLMRSGKPVKMSKRTGEIITLKELIEEVGPDAAKQIFLSRRWSSHLDFDIETAKDRSEKSPVYYLQYAHARICSIFRKAGDVQEADSECLLKLTAPEEQKLLRNLSVFPDTVESAALQLAPNRINSYLNDLATSFTRFYHECRVLSDDDDLTRARLAICHAVKIVLGEGLRLLGMSAPEAM